MGHRATRAAPNIYSVRCLRWPVPSRSVGPGAWQSRFADLLRRRVPVSRAASTANIHCLLGLWPWDSLRRRGWVPDLYVSRLSVLARSHLTHRLFERYNDSDNRKRQKACRLRETSLRTTRVSQHPIISSEVAEATDMRRTTRRPSDPRSDRSVTGD